MNSSQKKTARTLLIVNGLFFSGLFLVLSFNNRFALDDHHFMATMQQTDLWNGTWLEWESWSTRWASVMLNHAFHALAQRTGFALFFFGLFVLVSFTVAASWLTSVVLRRMRMPNEPPILLAGVGLFLVNGFFFASFKIDETWFWLCASCSFLVSMIAVLAGITWILEPRTSWWGWIMGPLCFVYVGGASGPLALIVLFGAVCWIAGRKVVAQKLDISEVSMVKLLVAAVLCLAAFTILYLGEGNRNRERLFEEISIVEALALNFKMVGILVIKRLPAVAAVAVLFAVPIVYFGSSFNRKKRDDKWLSKVIWASIIFAGFVFFYQLPITYKTQDIGAHRTLFPISVATLFYLIYVFWVVTKRWLRGDKLTLNLLFVALIAVIIVNGVVLIQQVGETSLYVNAYELRVKSLEKGCVGADPIALDRLPSSGLLLSAEVSSESTHFSNQQLVEAYGLNCQVIRELREGESPEMEWQPASMKKD